MGMNVIPGDREDLEQTLRNTERHSLEQWKPQDNGKKQPEGHGETRGILSQAAGKSVLKKKRVKCAIRPNNQVR